MKIIRLQASHVKRLSWIDISPDGNLVFISGKNAQGKTSVLDAFWLALGGGAATRAIENPIHDGETKASVTVDLGEIRVTRTWTLKGTRLAVSNADGSKVKSPQRLLDTLIGSLSFDPLKFISLSPKDQVTALLELVDLPFNPDEIEARRNAVFADRAQANLKVKNLQARFDSMPEPSAALPSCPVSTADLLDALRAETAQRARRASALENVRRHREAMIKAEEALDAARSLVAESEIVLHGLPSSDVDTDLIESRLEDVAAVNVAVAKAKEREDLRKELEVARGGAKALDDTLREIDETKAQGLKDAAMPIVGLGFNADGVTFQKQLLSECSSAERLRVGMSVAMARNPKVRVIRITDASLLDSESLALVKKMAEEKDFQVWLEVVDETGDVGYVIEDGQIVAENGVPRERVEA